MKVEVYAICYNEEVRLPYFLRHYDFCDITIYDNYSTDNSLNLCKGKAKIIKYDTSNELRDDIFMDIKNNCWKGSKADWVIVCDIDELVYHLNILEFLSKTKATIFQPPLYNMFSEKLPTTEGQIWEEIQYGVKDKPKMIIFNPKEIKEINYGAGCHEAYPTGNVILSKEEIITLHYQFISREYTIKRYKEFTQRLSEINRMNNWSYHYEFSEEKINKIYDDAKLIKVI